MNNVEFLGTFKCIEDFVEDYHIKKYGSYTRMKIREHNYNEMTITFDNDNKYEYEIADPWAADEENCCYRFHTPTHTETKILTPTQCLNVAYKSKEKYLKNRYINKLGYVHISYSDYIVFTYKKTPNQYSDDEDSNESCIYYKSNEL